MKVLIDIGHPAQVHFCKNIILSLEKDGHEVKITARDKDLTLRLLDIYGFKYENLGEIQKGLFNKAIEMIKVDFRLYKIAKKFKPDALMSKSSIYAAHVSKMIHKPYILVHDTEHATLANWLTFPFTDVICTPKSCKSEINPKKHVIFDGYKELAYLHPNYFKPDSSILDDLGLSKNDKFIVIRYVSWEASHDIGDKGLTNKAEVVKFLERYGRVLITSESKLPFELERYKITVSPERIHHVLYFAHLYIGESATMATESAILGTPAIFVSTSRRGYTDELESEYGLVYNFSDPKKMQEYALAKAFELLEDENVKKKWEKKRIKMLSEKIDVTKFMTDFIENYPESFLRLKNKEL
jgi:predicted glycosyltransferase